MYILSNIFLLTYEISIRHSFCVENLVDASTSLGMSGKKLCLCVLIARVDLYTQQERNVRHGSLESY